MMRPSAPDVLAAVHERDEVGFLATIELGLVSAYPAFRLGDLHMPSRVRSRIRSDSNSATMAKKVKQQPTYRVGRVVDRPAQAQTDWPGSELIGDRSGVGQRSGQAVELGHHQGVSGSAGRECIAGPGRSRLVPVRPWST